jgi:acyl-CoA thioester hydrolase
VRLELGRPTDRKPPFKYSALTRVGFSETDAQGVVYYGRYMPYFDLSRWEYFRHLELVGDERVGDFVMRAQTVDYVAPARFDDTIEVFARAARLGRTSVTFEHAAYRVEDDELMVTARQTLVHIDLADRRARPLPERFRAAVLGFEDDVEQ